MRRVTNVNLPVDHPFRTIYAAKRGGFHYRVARCTTYPGHWRIDVADWLLSWVPLTTDSYPNRDAAIAAFKVVPFGVSAEV